MMFACFNSGIAAHERIVLMQSSDRLQQFNRFIASREAAVKRKASVLAGISVPICTSFHGVGQEVDWNGVERHIDFLAESGITAIAVLDDCGEAEFLAGAEKKRLVETAARRIAGRVKLLVNVSAPRTADVVEFSRRAEGLGADALIVQPPPARSSDAGDVERHYEQAARSTDVPVMVENVPARGCFDVTPPLYKRLARISGVDCIMEGAGCMLRIERLVADGARVFCGCDYLMPYALMTGAVGGFWGGANVMPGAAVELYRLVESGRLPEAITLWHSIKKANVFYWTVNYNAAIKSAMQLMGRDLGDCRRPASGLSAEAIRELTTAHMPLLRKLDEME